MSAVIITGATRNTGYAIAERFAAEGYDVCITGRNAKEAMEAATCLSNRFPKIKVAGIELELSDIDSIQAAFKQFDGLFGELDVFVGNAAHLGVNMSLFNATPEDWDDVMGVNARGTFFCCKEAVSRMENGGAICLISSVHSHQCIPGRVLYTASKGAVNAMMRAMAVELGHKGIRVNSIIAGAIWTDRWSSMTPEQIDARRNFYPLGMESSPESIANGVYYLCSDQSSTVTGTELTIDSGISICLLPYRKDWHEE